VTDYHPPARIRLVEPEDVAAALADALAGGPPIAPLPPQGIERLHASAALQPEHAVTESDAAAVVLTSGSTGQPKGVVLTRRGMLAAVEATHRRLGGAGDWVLALPSHYVAGLMAVARSVVAGTRLLACASDLSNLSDATRTLPGDRPTSRRYISLVPTQLYRAVRQPHLVEALQRFDAVLVGGGAVGDEIVTRAQQSGLRVVTTYGMSETCGGCVYDGVPLDGVGVEIDQDDRVVISGDVVFAGYRLAPHLTARVLDDGRFRTSDRGRWVEHRLQILGRCDDVVVTGGLKVDLAEVEALAADWDREAETVVLALPSAEWGATLLAVSTSQRPLAGLQDALSGRLPAHAVPRRWQHLARLPHTASGKVDRLALRRLLEGAA
jgi:o-succinylbenzoate---CoA ligase